MGPAGLEGLESDRIHGGPGRQQAVQHRGHPDVGQPRRAEDGAGQRRHQGRLWRRAQFLQQEPRLHDGRYCRRFVSVRVMKQSLCPLPPLLPSLFEWGFDVFFFNLFESG